MDAPETVDSGRADPPPGAQPLVVLGLLLMLCGAVGGALFELFF